MLIPHPLLGLRDAQEFTYLGDAALLARPDGMSARAPEDFYTYLYLRDNTAGLHRELWYHEQGDRSWLIVERCTVTHEITRAILAQNLKDRAVLAQNLNDRATLCDTQEPCE